MPSAGLCLTLTAPEELSAPASPACGCLAAQLVICSAAVLLPQFEGGMSSLPHAALVAAAQPELTLQSRLRLASVQPYPPVDVRMPSQLPTLLLQGRRGPSGASGRASSHWQDRPGGGGCRQQGQVHQLLHLLQGLAPGQALPEAALQQALREFDSRGAALLLKDLGKCGLAARAAQLFDWLRRLPLTHPLAVLCDVYTFTALVSMCMHQLDAARAQRLVADMRACGVAPNVHTYTALMNVCIKCGLQEAALETYERMRREGCTPNVGARQFSTPPCCTLSCRCCLELSVLVQLSSAAHMALWRPTCKPGHLMVRPSHKCG